jgi:hypothetical protein
MYIYKVLKKYWKKILKLSMMVCVHRHHTLLCVCHFLSHHFREMSGEREKFDDDRNNTDFQCVNKCTGFWLYISGIYTLLGFRERFRIMDFFFSKNKSKTLAEATMTDLIEELRRRGMHVTVSDGAVAVSGGTGAPVDPSTGAALAASAATSNQRQVFAVLDAIEKWVQTDRHRNDRSRQMNEVWTYFRAFDWDRKPKGYVCDANKSVRVGVGQYSDYEDAQGSQIIIIMHYDSEQPGNYAKRDSCK